MRYFISALLATGLLGSPEPPQDLTTQLTDASGGVLVEETTRSCPAQLWVRPTSSAVLRVAVVDGSGVGVEGVQVQLYGWINSASDGGHAHADSETAHGTFTNSPQTTNPYGEVAFNWTVGVGSFLVQPYFQLTYQGEQTFSQPCNTVRIAEEEGDYEWIDTGNFILVGSTTTHPSNHYAKPGFNELLRELALDYGNRWNLNLAYNDSGLIWGGRFDISANWDAPHATHNIGESQDVRANGGTSSIPPDTAVRDWFVQKVQDLFGLAPLHESSGTPNEHYHIRR